ncbi:Cytochrome P450 [Corchorus olitorius]|uniref:Cytochrome P450 n=1 Tax=Corchorus olitorius TaxID=93759 RepID=A0A1R3IY65_9ROSI|nr:Cytochrome P450 [Corchorus olitorius]
MMSPGILFQQWFQQLNADVLFNPVIFFPLFFSILYMLKLSTSKKLNLPPSPPKLPIIGNILQVGKQPHRSFRTLSEKYGPVMLLHMGQTPSLVISSPEIARQVLLTHDAFIERPRIRVVETLFCGCTDIAFCPYGDYWRQAKKICVVELLTQKRVGAFQLVRELEVSRMIEEIRQLSQSGSAAALWEMFQTIANNIISRSVLGRVYERENGNKGFGELSKQAMDLIGAFCFKDFFPYLGWMDNLTGLTARLERISSELHNFLDDVIEEHLAMMADGDKPDSKKDFLDILLHLQQNGKLDIGLTQDNLKAILLCCTPFHRHAIHCRSSSKTCSVYQGLIINLR